MHNPISECSKNSKIFLHFIEKILSDLLLLVFPSLSQTNNQIFNVFKLIINFIRNYIYFSITMNLHILSLRFLKKAQNFT